MPLGRPGWSGALGLTVLCRLPCCHHGRVCEKHPAGAIKAVTQAVLGTDASGGVMDPESKQTKYDHRLQVNFLTLKPHETRQPT